MKNANNSQNMDFLKNAGNSEQDSECNNLDDKALLQDAEDKINSIKYTPESSSLDFERDLKSKILEKRNSLSIMDNILILFNSFMRPKRLVPIVSVVVLVAIVVNLTNFQSILQDVKKDPFGQFSKLVISPAYAMDNFEFEPESIDSLGVESDTSYILKSKEELDTKIIKESLTIEPDVDYDIEQISDLEWRITPKEPLSPNTILKASIKTSF